VRNVMVVLAVTILSCQCLGQQPVSKDAAVIYKAFLASYYDGSDTVLNIADRTVAFNPGFEKDSAALCLKEAKMPAGPSAEIHALDASILPHMMKARFIAQKDGNKAIRDPGDAIEHGGSVDDAVRVGIAAGVMTLSEVVFNEDHTRAVLSFSFHCGRLCGNGGAMLFKMRNGRWGRGTQVCGGWVS
jgi:hypothetical protein